MRQQNGNAITRVATVAKKMPRTVYILLAENFMSIRLLTVSRTLLVVALVQMSAKLSEILP